MPATLRVVTQQEIKAAKDLVSKWYAEFLEIIYESGRLDKDSYDYNDWEKGFEEATNIIAKGSVQKDLRRKMIKHISEFRYGSTIIMAFLEASPDPVDSTKIAFILRECTSIRNLHMKKRNASLKYAVLSNYVPCILKQLALLKDPKSFIMKDKLTEDMIGFMGDVSEKDKKFALKVLHLDKVKFMHFFIKYNYFQDSLQEPLLKILKSLVKNGRVAKELGKLPSLVAVTIKQALYSCNNQHQSTKLQLVLDVIAWFTKTKFRCGKFMQAGYFLTVIRVFESYNLWTGQKLHRFVKTMLIIYTNVSKTKTGKEILVKNSALSVVEKFLGTCSHERCYIDSMARLIVLHSICRNKMDLPYGGDKMSPIEFDITRFTNIGTKDDNDNLTSESDEDGRMKTEVSDEEYDDDDLCLSSSSEDEYIDQSGSGDEPESKMNGEVNIKRLDTASLLQVSASKFSEFDVIMENRPLTSSSIMSVEALEEVRYFFREMDDFAQQDYELDSIQASDRIFHLFDYLNFFPERSEAEIIGSAEIPIALHDWELCCGLPSGFKNIFEDQLQNRIVYKNIANQTTQSIIPFVKLPYPDCMLSFTSCDQEILGPPTTETIKMTLEASLKRASGTLHYRPKIVYDLDELVKSGNVKSGNRKNLINNDEQNLGKYDHLKPLKFESRFECGNLRKAIQMGERDYDLLVTPDINSPRHSQWFYFQISNIVNKATYTFNIINCLNGSSQFNHGMQPVMFSVSTAVEGRPGWVRAGSNIYCHRNGYRSSPKEEASYFTFSFQMAFEQRGDIVYLAYHMPYSYTRLLTDLYLLNTWARTNKPNILYRCEELCLSINKNPVPVVTITAKGDSEDIYKREIVYLTARVHPGEANASWVMIGVLMEFFGESEIADLLNNCVIKIIPMLNPDGVIHGCQRCELTGDDLNRRWKFPHPFRHPTIYYTKTMIEYSCRKIKRTPMLFVDMHGHSTKKNTFLYGCLASKSWCEDDKTPECVDKPETSDMPTIMKEVVPLYCAHSSMFDVKETRESTARVTLWRDYDIARSYTLETSYCGSDFGIHKDTQFGTQHLIELGQTFVTAMQVLYQKVKNDKFTEEESLHVY